MTHVYAEIHQLTAIRVQVDRLNCGKVQRTGYVVKMGANHYSAKRMFGQNAHKDFVGPRDGMVVDEADTYARACRWAVGGFDSVAPRT